MAKRIYVGKYPNSHSVGRMWKSWIDTIKDCLKKRGLDVRKARRILHDGHEWQEFVRRNAWDVA